MILCLPVQTLEFKLYYIHTFSHNDYKKKRTCLFFFFPGPVCLKMQQWL